MQRCKCAGRCGAAAPAALHGRVARPVGKAVLRFLWVQFRCRCRRCCRRRLCCCGSGSCRLATCGLAMPSSSRVMTSRTTVAATACAWHGQTTDPSSVPRRWHRPSMGATRCRASRRTAAYALTRTASIRASCCQTKHRWLQCATIVRLHYSSPPPAPAVRVTRQCSVRAAGMAGLLSLPYATRRPIPATVVELEVTGGCSSATSLGPTERRTVRFPVQAQCQVCIRPHPCVCVCSSADCCAPWCSAVALVYAWLRPCHASPTQPSC